MVALRRVVIKFLYFFQNAVGQDFFGFFFHVHHLARETTPEKRHGAATVRPNPANLWKFVRCASKQHAGNGASGVGGVFNRRVRQASDEVSAAIGLQGMNINDRFATVELLPNWPEMSISQIQIAVAGHQTNAVSFERVVGIGDFTETAFHVHQRQCGK